MSLPTLDTAIAAARKLRDDQQELLAREILERVAELDEDHLTAEQRALVKQRLGAPARYASAEDVRDFFARHRVRD